MSRFTSVLVVSPYQDGKTWYLRSPLVYEVGALGSNDLVAVPQGFTTDFASIPRLFWIVLPRWGKYGNAAVVHDYLYYDQSRSRREADQIFFEAMEVLEVPYWQRDPMHWAVRAFGWFDWMLNRRKKALGYRKWTQQPPLKATALPVHWRVRRPDYARLLLGFSRTAAGPGRTAGSGAQQAPLGGPGGAGGSSTISSATPASPGARDLQKYQELYALAKEAFAEELARSARVDDKASKYLAAVGIVIGAWAFFAKYAMDSCIPVVLSADLALLVLTPLLLFLLLGTGWALFSTLRVHVFVKIPVEPDFFKQNTLATVYWAMARGMKDGMLQNRKQGNLKAAYLTRAYHLMAWDVALLVLACAAYAARCVQVALVPHP